VPIFKSERKSGEVDAIPRRRRFVNKVKFAC
jgi:hypothetical protein